MIELDHVQLQLHGKMIVNDVSLRVSKGEVVALIGPSGAGKTSILRCISGLEWPTSGSISIEDEALTPVNAARLRLSIGMVFQHFHLFPHLNVMQNMVYAPVHVLRMPKEEAQSKAEELLRSFGLQGKELMHPSRLSGGEKQRVAMARALIMQPRMMLFDEPTSALDPEKIGEVIQLMTSVLASRMTSLIVTHSMQLARRVATRIVFLDHGEIVEDSPADLFFAHPQTERAQAFLRFFA